MVGWGGLGYSPESDALNAVLNDRASGEFSVQSPFPANLDRSDIREFFLWNEKRIADFKFVEEVFLRATTRRDRNAFVDFSFRHIAAFGLSAFDFHTPVGITIRLKMPSKSSFLVS